MKTLTSINQISSQTTVGRMLLAAIAVITTESRTTQTPDEVLKHCGTLLPTMFQGEPEPDDNAFVKELLTMAKNEIVRLKNQNNISSARLQVFDQMTAIFNNQPARTMGSSSGWDVTNDIDKFLTQL